MNFGGMGEEGLVVVLTKYAHDMDSYSDKYTLLKDSGWIPKIS